MKIEKIVSLVLAIVVIGVGVFLFVKYGDHSSAPQSQQPISQNEKPKTPANTQQQGTINNLKNIYTGFPKIKKGEWSEWVTYFKNGKTGHQVVIYRGEKTLNGQQVYGVEVDSTMEDGTHPVILVWFKKGTSDIVKIVSKGFNGSSKVFCVTKEQVEAIMPDFASQVPSPDTPEEYKPNQPGISYGEYTTPTGKKVKVAKIKTTKGVSWVSSQVPFGIVKIIDIENGREREEGYLYDFGKDGKQFKLTSQEEDNCLSLSF